LHPGVEEAAVVGSPDPVLGESVEAYVVGRGGFRDAGVLRIHVAGRLAPHKLPRRYVFVESLPRTPTGKVRKALLREEGPDGTLPSPPESRGPGMHP
jgi:acyl-coenzyme A synthetase/AMP-(fatty) acid ligase